MNDNKILISMFGFLIGMMWNISDFKQREQSHYNAMSQALIQNCTQTENTIQDYCTKPKTKGKKND